MRVRIDMSWGGERDSDGDLIVDLTLSTDNIIINYNTEKWYYNEDDGYYYYLGVLKPGQTTESVFEDFWVEGKTYCYNCYAAIADRRYYKRIYVWCGSIYFGYSFNCTYHKKA